MFPWSGRTSYYYVFVTGFRFAGVGILAALDFLALPLWVWIFVLSLAKRSMESPEASEMLRDAKQQSVSG